jgi:hypothetical protein
MRLVITGSSGSVWVRLEPDTLAETVALAAAATRGQATVGRGVDAIPRLHALAAELGHPATQEVQLPPALPPLVVVQRGRPDLYARLTALARHGVVVIWDRREGERRSPAPRPAPAAERRRRPRRRAPPETWTVLGFLLVPAAR